MPLRILFLENDELAAEMYLAVLSQEYQVELATDVIQAADAKDRLSKFDLVILDVMMPPLGEFTLSETKRGLETGLRLFERDLQDRPTRDKSIPVLLLTAAIEPVLTTIREFADDHKPQIIGVLRKSETDAWALKKCVDDWATSAAH